MAKTIPRKIGVIYKPELQDLPDPWLKGLVQDQLTAKDRLHLFGASKATAAVVARQADSIQLTLSRQDDGDNNCGNTQLQARVEVLQTILEAAWETPLYVVLHSPRDFPSKGQLPVRWGVVPKASVVSLTLQGANLSVALPSTFSYRHVNAWERGSSVAPVELLDPDAILQSSGSLSLQECQWLHTLVLGAGCDWTSCFGIATLLHQREAWAPPALSCLQVHEYCSPAAARVMVQLLGPQISQFHCNQQLTDGLLQTLVARPKLTHVSTCSLSLQLDHRYGSVQMEPYLQRAETAFGECWVPMDQDQQWKAFKCEQLQLKNGTHVEALMKLPLQNIKQLVVKGFLNYDGAKPMKDDQVQHLARCPSLQCVPMQHDIQGLAEPLFAVTGQVNTALLRMCISSLTTICALYLCGCTRASMTALLPCLRHLPVTVVALGFQMAGKGPLQHTTAGQRAQYWCELLSVLPSHVNRLLLQPPNSTDLEVEHCFLHVMSLLGEMAGNANCVDKVVHLVLPKDAQAKQLKALQRKYPRKLRLLRCGKIQQETEAQSQLRLP